MAKLFSHHDPSRIHATLGFLALASYVRRFVFLVRYGTSFPLWEPPVVAVGSVLVHLLLHVSSFIPPLPPKRIMHSPMIWTEFRLHNAIFGSRHVVATVVALLARGGSTRKKFPAVFFAAFFLVYAPASLASAVSRRYGDRDKRTTNSMAYPVDEARARTTKTWYANAQFAATFFAMSGAPTAAYWPLLAIQLAPLMMTLVRKGIATTAAYHRVYSLALALPYVVYVVVLNDQLRNTSAAEPEYATSFFSWGVLPAVFAPKLRRLGVSKHIALSLFLLAFLVAAAYDDKTYHPPAWLEATMPKLNLVALLGTVYGLVRTPFHEAKWMFATYHHNNTNNKISSHNNNNDPSSRRAAVAHAQ